MVKSKKKASNVFDVTAIENERNIDLFLDRSSGKSKTFYFNSARGKLGKLEPNKSYPDFKLVEARRYVLGAVYIWEKAG